MTSGPAYILAWLFVLRDFDVGQVLRFESLGNFSEMAQEAAKVFPYITFLGVAHDGRLIITYKSHNVVPAFKVVIFADKPRCLQS